jgi:uncharacterized protein YbjT (DUF2867 family)
VGRPLLERFVREGWNASALARAESASSVPPGCRSVIGNALVASTYQAAMGEPHTFIHLVGVPKPSPWKGPQFRRIDLPAFTASLEAARQSRVSHFIYLSVAHPAPVMKAYIDVRRECEQMLAESGLNHTILRPWYVLGKGHWWPYALLPAYKLFEQIPACREGALRLGLVTHAEMVKAIFRAAEEPVQGAKILDVPAIRAAALR